MANVFVVVTILSRGAFHSERQNHENGDGDEDKVSHWMSPISEGWIAPRSPQLLMRSARRRPPRSTL